MVGQAQLDGLELRLEGLLDLGHAHERRLARRLPLVLQLAPCLVELRRQLVEVHDRPMEMRFLLHMKRREVLTQPLSAW